MLHLESWIVVLNKRKIGREVTKRQSERRQHVPREVIHVHVLKWLVAVQNVENKWEHDDEDREEKQEYLQIDDDVQDHCYNVTEGLEYAHKEECLDQLDEDNDNHDWLSKKTPRSEVILKVNILNVILFLQAQVVELVAELKLPIIN